MWVDRGKGGGGSDAARVNKEWQWNLLVVRDEVIVLDKELASLDKNHDDSRIEDEKERCRTIEADVKRISGVPCR